MTLTIQDIAFEGVYTSPSMKGFILAVGKCRLKQLHPETRFINIESPRVFDIYLNGHRAATFTIAARPTLVNPRNVCQPAMRIEMRSGSSAYEVRYCRTSWLPSTIICLYVGPVISPRTANAALVRASLTDRYCVTDHKRRIRLMARTLFTAHSPSESPTPGDPITPIMSRPTTPPLGPPPPTTFHTLDTPIKEPPRLRYLSPPVHYFPDTPMVPTPQDSDSEPSSPILREIRLQANRIQGNICSSINRMERRLLSRLDALDQGFEVPYWTPPSSPSDPRFRRVD